MKAGIEVVDCPFSADSRAFCFAKARWNKLRHAGSRFRLHGARAIPGGPSEAWPGLRQQSLKGGASTRSPLRGLGPARTADGFGQARSSGHLHYGSPGPRRDCARFARAVPEGEASIGPPASRVWAGKDDGWFRTSPVIRPSSLRFAGTTSGLRSLCSRCPGGGGFDRPTRFAGLVTRAKAAPQADLVAAFALVTPLRGADRRRGRDSNPRYPCG